MVFVLSVGLLNPQEPMLTPRLTNCCGECSDIQALIDDIDCKLAMLAGDLYNNTVFMLNRPVQATTMINLLHYRRILQYKYVNSDYASAYTISMIAGKIKLLKYK